MSGDTDDARFRSMQPLGVTLAVIAAVGAIAATGIASSWPADGWAAAASWVTALIAGVAAIVALRQLGEARRLRLEQAQPYVVAYMDPSGAGNYFLDLVLRNFGTTAAHDVRLTIDPPPQQAAHQSRMLWLPESLPVLAPGQEWRTFWDSGARVSSDLPERHEASVRCKDSVGRELPPLASILDFAAHKQGNLVVYGMHDAAKALREIDKRLRDWKRPGRTGLAVTVWSGDAADEREREWLERQERNASTEDDASTTGHDQSGAPFPRQGQ
jgi:hypothetical protein